MASVNKVIIVGNLGADPETRYMPSGDAVTNIRVATTDRYKDKASGEMKGNHRVAPHRLLRSTGRDRRRIPEEGLAGLHRRPPQDSPVGEGRPEAIQHRNRRRPNADAWQGARRSWHGRR